MHRWPDSRNSSRRSFRKDPWDRRRAAARTFSPANPELRSRLAEDFSSMRRRRFSVARIAEVFAMLAKKELVGHSGDVITNDDVARFHLREFFVSNGHRAFAAQVINEKLFQALHGAIAVLGDRRMVVDVSEKKALQIAILRSRGVAEASEANWCLANASHG